MRKFWRNLWGRREPKRPEPRRATEPTGDWPTPPAMSVASGESILKVGVLSVTGNVREHNEDNYYVPGRPSLSPPGGNGSRVDGPDAIADAPSGLFIVADGMGGQLAGEEASRMAVILLPRELGKRLEVDDDDKAIIRALREAVAAASNEILAQSQVITEFANMGTTAVLALFRGRRAFITGVGDSRAYRLRDAKIERLTKDHSLAEALSEAGTIRPDEVEDHKFKHVLYLYLGSKDARDGPDSIRSLDVQPGDRFLLASDGLTGVVRDETLAEILAAGDDPQRTAQALVNRALENKSKDNITCVVIHVDRAGRPAEDPGHGPA